MNFIHDFSEIIRKNLEESGYKLSSDMTDDELCREFLNRMNRLIESRPRTVLRADTFSCSREHGDGLALVVTNIESGVDLEPHLSERVKRNAIDHLLLEWGVHHLHLGLKQKGDFYERTGPLLYARFDADTAYLLGIFDHASWAKQDIIETLHRNWPDSIHQFRAKLISGQHLSEERRLEFRRHGVMGVTTVQDGTVYFPLGGGYSTGQGSVMDVLECDRVHEKIQAFQDSISDNIASLRNRIKHTGQTLPPDPDFFLSMKDGVVFAVERSTHAHIILGQL